MEVLRTRGEFTEQQGRWSAKELLSPFDASSLEPKLSINYPYVRRAFILLLCLALCPSYCSSVCLSVCSIARNFATEKHNSHEKRNPINYSVIIKDVVISPTDMQRALECGSLNGQNLARPDVALRIPGAVKTTEDITQSTSMVQRSVGEQTGKDC